MHKTSHYSTTSNAHKLDAAYKIDTHQTSGGFYDLAVGVCVVALVTERRLC